MAEAFELGNRRVKLFDLSDRLENSTTEFEPNRHHIEYVNHRQSVKMAEEVFDVDAGFWPDGMAWAVENVTLSTHSGTHVDAPYHYGPNSGGRPARTIDQVPLRWCFGEGVVLDMSHKNRGEGITGEDIRAELERIEYRLKPYDIVLVRTDAWKYFKETGYEMAHAGLRRSATEWLVDQGVRLIGIDAWGLDRPFDSMVAEAHAGNKEQLWESHFLGKEKEYCQIEKLCHLDELPVPYGFLVVAFPVKLHSASASWSRVVAIVEDGL